MSPRTQKLINELCDAAKHWGWQQDQGAGRSVANSESNYLAAKKQLEDHLERIAPRRHKKVLVESRAGRPKKRGITVGRALTGNLGRETFGAVLDG